MNTAHELQWHLRGRRPGWRWWLAVGLVLVALLVLWRWKQQVDTRLAVSEIRLQQATRLTASEAASRVVAPTGLDAAGARQVNAQIALLNRDWSGLLNGLEPRDDAVKLLATDINPATGAIRITAGASTPAEANAYAQRLQERSVVLRDVRLLSLEREAGRIEFEVTAQWIE